eukprot:UN16870
MRRLTLLQNWVGYLDHSECQFLHWYYLLQDYLKFDCFILIDYSD